MDKKELKNTLQVEIEKTKEEYSKLKGRLDTLINLHKSVQGNDDVKDIENMLYFELENTKESYYKMQGKLTALYEVHKSI